MTRVSVFIDYQNVYHRARGAFGLEHDGPAAGHVRPLRLGALVNLLGHELDPDRKLEQVRLYRGEPSSKSHPRLQAAYQRQTAGWRQVGESLLTVRTRPLRYPVIGWDANGRPNQWGKPEEKGIDVLIALDMVMGAMCDDYDVAVLISGDTDLIPAIDAVIGLEKRVENAVWWPDNEPGHPLRTGVQGAHLWCHRLTRTHFTSVRDDTDYSAAMPEPEHL